MELIQSKSASNSQSAQSNSENGDSFIGEESDQESEDFQNEQEKTITLNELKEFLDLIQFSENEEEENASFPKDPISEALFGPQEVDGCNFKAKNIFVFLFHEKNQENPFANKAFEFEESPSKPGSFPGKLKEKNKWVPEPYIQENIKKMKYFKQNELYDLIHPETGIQKKRLLVFLALFKTFGRKRAGLLFLCFLVLVPLLAWLQ